MDKEKPQKVIKHQGGFFQDTMTYIKLIGRLMADKRISPVLKLLPISSLIYFISPIDLMIGPLDDAAIVGLALYFFIEFCPKEVVDEHLKALENVTSNIPQGFQSSNPSEKPIQEEDIIEAEFHDKEKPIE
ncbi:MAG: YkvA family protein [Chloroflexota bacterium]